jgi:RNA polymerase sigma-70 factor (ECF subfamily)
MLRALMPDEPEAGALLALFLHGRLSGYRYLPAIKADLLRRLGRRADAAAAYRAALALADNEAERMFLADRLADVEIGGPGSS